MHPARLLYAVPFLLAFAVAPTLARRDAAQGPTAADGFAIHVTAPHQVQGHEMGPVHHFCKPISPEPIIQCLLFDTAEPDAALNGVEYIIAKSITRSLVSLGTWNANFHDHKLEIATGRVKVLDLPPAEAKKVADLVATTDGIIFHLWPIGDRIPTGSVEIAQSVGHRPLPRFFNPMTSIDLQNESSCGAQLRAAAALAPRRTRGTIVPLRLASCNCADSPAPAARATFAAQRGSPGAASMHHLRWFVWSLALTATPFVLHAQSQEQIDYQMLSRIREEGLQRSQVMDLMSWMADVHGPRLTGSPGFKAAGDWAVQTMTKWGLANVKEEPWAFGRGWSLERFSAHMIEPTVQPLIGYPKAWTPGTKGVITGDLVQVLITTPGDFDKYRGKLQGKVVLPQAARDVRMLEGNIVLKMGEREIAEAETTPVPPTGGQRFTPPTVSPAQVMKFYIDEGVAAVLDRGSDSDMSAGGSDLSWMTQRTDGGTIFVGSGGGREPNATPVLPQVTLAVEHYNRMVRILQKGVPVKVELDVRVKFNDEPSPNGFNIVAEIPGTDPKLKDEIVLIGAHFDSWHAGTGATDNASGSSAMMEAMRILKTLGVKPRRTIRIGLWGGEEQGLLGSRAYVRQHLADAGNVLPEHAKLSSYFNIDNGTGRIRGVWLQQNYAVAPIFQQWISPLKDLGVTTLGPRAVASTDHSAFDAVGIPGFQFMQERLEYNSRTHHSNMDVVDRVQRDDMVQMATVVAWFAYSAAQRDALLPRKPMPANRVAQ